MFTEKGIRRLAREEVAKVLAEAEPESLEVWFSNERSAQRILQRLLVWVDEQTDRARHGHVDLAELDDRTGRFYRGKGRAFEDVRDFIKEK